MKVGDRVVVRSRGSEEDPYAGEEGNIVEARDSGPFDWLVKLDGREYCRLFAIDEIEPLEEK
jgi:hypothetical protein